MASNSDPNVKRPSQSERGKKSGGKPIRLIDLIPSKDVKGGATTVFGGRGTPEDNNQKIKTNK